MSRPGIPVDVQDGLRDVFAVLQARALGEEDLSQELLDRVLGDSVPRHLAYVYAITRVCAIFADECAEKRGVTSTEMLAGALAAAERGWAARGTDQ